MLRAYIKLTVANLAVYVHKNSCSWLFRGMVTDGRDLDISLILVYFLFPLPSNIHSHSLILTVSLVKGLKKQSNVQRRAGRGGAKAAKSMVFNGLENHTLSNTEDLLQKNEVLLHTEIHTVHVKGRNCTIASLWLCTLLSNKIYYQQ